MDQFANQVSPWSGPIFLTLLTFAAGFWLGRREGAAGPLNGLAVGVLAGLLNLAIGFSLSLGDLAAFILAAAAGWLGGTLGNRGRAA
jgi:putative membrane protein (TIGR04086 family)